MLSVNLINDHFEHSHSDSNSPTPTPNNSLENSLETTTLGEQNRNTNEIIKLILENNLDQLLSLSFTEEPINILDQSVSLADKDRELLVDNLEQAETNTTNAPAEIYETAKKSFEYFKNFSFFKNLFVLIKFLFLNRKKNLNIYIYYTQRD
jgi:hypothetical protein